MFMGQNYIFRRPKSYECVSGIQFQLRFFNLTKRNCSSKTEAASKPFTTFVAIINRNSN